MLCYTGLVIFLKPFLSILIRDCVCVALKRMFIRSEFISNMLQSLPIWILAPMYFSALLVTNYFKLLFVSSFLANLVLVLLMDHVHNFDLCICVNVWTSIIPLTLFLFNIPEWEKTLQLIGLVGIGLVRTYVKTISSRFVFCFSKLLWHVVCGLKIYQTIYWRVSSYNDSEDLKKDVRYKLVVWLVRLWIAWRYQWAQCYT